MATSAGVTANGGDFVQIYNMQDATDNDAEGSVFGSVGQTNTTIFVEGTASIPYQAKGSGWGWAGMWNSGNNQNIASTHLRLAVRSLDPFENEGFANGGTNIRVSNTQGGASTYGEWEVGGQDTLRATVDGFLFLCIDTDKAYDNSSSPPTLTSVDGFYAGGNMQSGSGQNTFFVDNICEGNVIQVYGGTTGARGNSVELAAITAVREYGAFKDIGGVYYVLSGMDFGETGTATSYFQDTGQVWNFEGQNVANDLYTITIEGNATGTNHFQMGTKVGTGITATGINGNTWLATQEPFNLIATDANVDAVNMYGCNFLNSTTAGGTFNITNTSAEIFSCLFSSCDEITLGSGVEFRFNTIVESTASATEAAINMGAVNPGTSDAVRDLNISGGTNGMKFTGTGNRTIDLKNIKFSDMTDYLYIDHGAGDTITINNTEGTTSMVEADINNVNSSTLVIVNAPVTALIAVTDNLGVDLQNARVLAEAADGTGDLPFEESVTITRSGSTATVVHTAHGMVAGDYAVIRGANQSEYNGAKTITITTANAYTFTVSGTPTTPATGTIISSGALISGLTDANGEISRSRTYVASQPIIGYVRKSTTSPLFQDFSLAGNTVSSTSGLTVNVRMILDE